MRKPILVWGLQGLALAAGLTLAQFAVAGVDAQLAQDVLALDQQLVALEREHTAGLADFSVFIGSQRNELRLRKLSLRIDELPAVQYEYAEAEWQALAAGGLHPAWTGMLSEGEHRLRIELFARTVDAGPTDPRAVERLDRLVQVRRGGAIELAMVQERFGKTGLAVTEWSDNTSASPGTPAHPWIRAGQFWIGADRPYAAARMLRRLQGRAASAPWSADADALLALSLQQLAGQSRGDSPAIAATEAFRTATEALASGDAAPLQLLAKQDAESETDWTRRDHANLLLGYHALRQGDGEAALEALGRVRSAGLHGTEALLGFGWAFLLPETPTAQPARLGGSGSTLQQPSFVVAAGNALTIPKEDRRKALQRALVPWTELIGRDPLDPAAQEGTLALAWALDQLNTGAQAHLHYERTAAQLETARGLLERAMEHVASGAAAEAVASGQNDEHNGWRTWLADLPYADDTAYLKYLLTDVRFVDALDPYRDARLLHDEVEAMALRLQALPAGDARIAALQARVDAARVATRGLERDRRAQMERSALERLRAHKLRTERYLVEARLALARHFDSAPEPEIEYRRQGSPS